ncbi:T9SS type A sorting domain-containing protein [Cognatitamlana onchidii]|uniref:T9SS type A sorting domain-containing protein n=1 Tax=Cognatitamlana onchidii TaxID=2562860 RepID=UPI0010A65A16|nr:T9SS type A sorting domain-containing protein [Algibacter onchidii]
MKKIYTFLIAVFTSVIMLNAQDIFKSGQSVGFFSSDFTEASYDAPTAQTLINNHPDWLSQEAWSANATDQIELDDSNWKKLILDKSIQATDGQFITATFDLVIGRDSEVINDGAKVWWGFKNGKDLGDFNDREGILFSGDFGDFLVNSQSHPDATGSTPFPSPIYVPATANTAYSVQVEIALGSDAASSSLSAKVGDETASVTGIDPQLYTAFTTGNVYFWSWAYGWAQADPDPLTGIFLNKLTVQVTDSPILSTTNAKNAFEFGLSPNPTKNLLRIQTGEAIKSVQVLDLLGREVMSRTGVIDVIDVSSLKSALYLVRLTSEKGTSTRKFVKH